MAEPHSGAGRTLRGGKRRARGGASRRLRVNKLFPQKKVRPEMAQKERKKALEKYFLPAYKP